MPEDHIQQETAQGSQAMNDIMAQMNRAIRAEMEAAKQIPYTSGAVQSAKVGEMLAGAAAEAHGGYTVPSQADTLGSQMQDCCNNIRRLRELLRRATWAHQDMLDSLELRRAQVLVLGLQDDKRIAELKPEAVREAALTIVLSQDKAYDEYRTREWGTRQEVQRLEVDLEYHRNRLAALRSQARLAAAEMEAGR